MILVTLTNMTYVSCVRISQGQSNNDISDTDKYDLRVSCVRISQGQSNNDISDTDKYDLRVSCVRISQGQSNNDISDTDKHDLRVVRQNRQRVHARLTGVSHEEGSVSTITLQDVFTRQSRCVAIIPTTNGHTVLIKI